MLSCFVQSILAESSPSEHLTSNEGCGFLPNPTLPAEVRPTFRADLFSQRENKSAARHALTPLREEAFGKHERIH